MRRMRRAALLVLCALSGCGGAGKPSQVAPPAAKRAPPPPPALVVAIVVDQLAAWIAEERLPLLPEGGGFARLRREGTWVQRARHAHAVTDTAPGHAALFTGRSPRETGIVANELLDEHGEFVSVLRDPATKLVDDEGVTQKTGSSIARLRVPTVADALRAARADATIVSVSIKDRGAIFGGGRSSSATLWFDVGLDRFVTSSGFASALPRWALPHATHAAVASLRSGAWTLLDPPWVKAHAATADDQPGEGDWDGLGRTFPHDLGHAKEPAVPFRATPFADEAVLSLAAAAVRARDASKPMFLAVSLSANDYVSHVFGPDSWESWDELRRIDASLAKLFALLDAEVGSEGWSVVLGADHGGATLPETASGRPWCGPSPDAFARACRLVPRIYVHELGKELRAVAEQAIGPGDWVLGVADPLVMLTPAARALDEARRQKLEAALLAKLKSDPRIADAFVVRTLPETCAKPAWDMSIADLVCRSVPRDGPGDVYVVPAPGAFFDTRYVVGFGENHGTPYVYDRTVPVLARGPGIAHGRVLSDARLATTYTRTLAALLGLAFDAPGTDLTHE